MTHLLDTHPLGGCQPSVYYICATTPRFNMHSFCNLLRLFTCFNDPFTMLSQYTHMYNNFIQNHLKTCTVTTMRNYVLRHTLCIWSKTVPISPWARYNPPLPLGNFQDNIFMTLYNSNLKSSCLPLGNCCLLDRECLEV